MVGYCDPLIFKFTKLASLDLSSDLNFDITALPLDRLLPGSITSLVLRIRLHWGFPTPSAKANYPHRHSNKQCCATPESHITGDR